MKNKTHEQFIKEISDLVNNEYTVLDKYINSSTKIRIKHNKCGKVYLVTPNKFLQGRRCPRCSKLNQNEKQRKTHEQFVKEVDGLVSDEYTVLDEYVNSSTKIRIKHNKCGNVYLVMPNKFLQGNRCCKCNKYTKNRNRDIEVFKCEVFNLYKNEYEVLGEYVNNKTKIKMKHNICNHVYEVVPSSFLRGRRCPNCYRKYKKNTNQFKMEVFNLYKNEYEVLGEYLNVKTKIKMKHNICNHVYEVVPSSFLRGRRCPNCFGTPKKTTNNFKEEIYRLVGNEYILLDEYKTNNTKVTLKHIKCNYVYNVTPRSFKQGARCPNCNQSRGEQKISFILKSYNINFETQYKFKDCKHKKSLPFDFAIFKNNKVVLLIEFDGIQHYKPIDRFGGKEALKCVKLRDNIKTQYCIKKNIHLLRIPYWEVDNVNKIILKKLSKMKLI